MLPQAGAKSLSLTCMQNLELIDEPHSTSSRCTGLSPEVVTLSEDSLLTSCENKLGMLWLDMPLPELFSGCFRTKPPPLCFKFISKTPHQSQQWQHARWFVGPCWFVGLRGKWPLLDRQDKSSCISISERSEANRHLPD